jgi:lipopolysaccharide transport system permease protein
MVFKTELLPVSAAMTGIVPMAISMVFVAVLLIASGNPLSWHAAVVPAVILLQFLFIISVGFFLSAIQVFVRDFGIVLPNLMMAILFTSPIFYPYDSMPGVLKLIASANPFYILVEGYRAPLIHHQLPGLTGLVYVLGITLVLALIGLRFFRRLKGYFISKL